MKIQKTNFVIIGLSILLVAAVVWGAVASSTGVSAIGAEEAKKITETFINETLMTSGTSATIASVEKVNGLYRMMVDIGSGQEVASYVSLDGSTFFPQGLSIKKDITEPTVSDTSGTNQTTPTNVPKSDKPIVELFVMSYCPYGTQIEKGILPAIEALGDDIDFKLKFVDYAMHGQRELNEQLNQYCIMEEYPKKFNEYLTCFLDEGESAGCIEQIGANENKLANCITDTDEDYKITSNFENKVNFKGSYPEFGIYKDDNVKYGVGGSPTLVINGSKTSSSRDSASLLNTICSAFEEQPEACGTQLSSASPSPGFGFDTSAGSNSAATCN